MKETFDTLLSSGESFVITTHEDPDGDSIGSEMALYHHLRSCGKEVTVVNGDPTPDALRFLDPDDVIRVANDVEGPIAWDAVIVVDAAVISRFEDALKPLPEPLPRLFAIDHHIRCSSHPVVEDQNLLAFMDGRDDLDAGPEFG